MLNSNAPYHFGYSISMHMVFPIQQLPPEQQLAAMIFHTKRVQTSHTSENVLTISLERKARESSTSQSVHIRMEVYSSSNEVHEKVTYP